MTQLRQEINYKYGTRYEFNFIVYDKRKRAHVHRFMVTKYYPEDVKPFYSLRHYLPTREMRLQCIAPIEHYLN